MKVKQPGLEQHAAKKTTVTPLGGDTVKLFHQQGVKQSTNYQSGDVVYAIEMHVENTPEAIRRGVAACENIVENALGDKLPQMNQLLRGLAHQNK